MGCDAVPDLVVVCALVDDLGGHREGRADTGGALCHCLCDLLRNAKVLQLHIPALAQQHVRRCRCVRAEGAREEGNGRRRVIE